MALAAIYNDSFDDELVLLFHSLTKMNYLGEVDHATKDFTCQTYKNDEVFNYNFFIWCTSFFFSDSSSRISMSASCKTSHRTPKL
jgi:hypothetical protein